MTPPLASGPLIRVVDDDALQRRMSMRLLRLHGFAVRDFPSADAFLEDLESGGARDELPGCIVLDLRMPGMSGLELQEVLAHAGVALPILFCTGYGDVPSSVRAMKAGAVDFLTKPFEADELLEAVRRAVERDVADRAIRHRRDELHARVATLTKREQEVFSLVIVGKLNKQIADRLGMAERTVKAHRSRILEKLRVESVAEMVHLAGQIGLLTPLEIGPAIPGTRQPV
jgi:FixJ family two-component response regulator